MPNKPTKYGIKINMACDARNSYMLNGIVDLAKHRRPQVVPGKLGEYYTMTLTEPYLDSNRTITVDNWFTSLSLVKELYKRNTYLIGTSRRKGYVPKIMVDKKFTRPVDSSIFLFHENVSMVSFKPKKDKIVLLLSSKHNSSAIGKRNKPEAIHFYNKTKGGVDVLDMMCARYNCNRKTRRWPLYLFYAMLNIAVINCFILSKLQQNCQTKFRRLFMHTLARELVQPWAEKRLQQAGMKLSASHLIRSCFSLTSNEEPQRQQAGKGKKRCSICEWKTASQTRTYCSYCVRAVCPRHYSVICNKCEDDDEDIK
ncbi:piggyBac transposable element-derived protein 4-like [Palaemon carinicauda]|uniref:piggyBac transposable element-derived protein 4-like n=1 Tax=Palaemon carinicauda TaxID=392227 RepID=UPI0035B633CC